MDRLQSRKIQQDQQGQGIKSLQSPMGKFGKTQKKHEIEQGLKNPVRGKEFPKLAGNQIDNGPDFKSNVSQLKNTKFKQPKLTPLMGKQTLNGMQQSLKSKTFPKKGATLPMPVQNIQVPMGPNQTYRPFSEDNVNSKSEEQSNQNQQQSQSNNNSNNNTQKLRKSIDRKVQLKKNQVGSMPFSNNLKKNQKKVKVQKGVGQKQEGQFEESKVQQQQGYVKKFRDQMEKVQQEEIDSNFNFENDYYNNNLGDKECISIQEEEQIKEDIRNIISITSSNKNSSQNPFENIKQQQYSNSQLSNSNSNDPYKEEAKVKQIQHKKDKNNKNTSSIIMSCDRILQEAQSGSLKNSMIISTINPQQQNQNHYISNIFSKTKLSQNITTNSNSVNSNSDKNSQLICNNLSSNFSSKQNNLNSQNILNNNQTIMTQNQSGYLQNQTLTHSHSNNSYESSLSKQKQMPRRSNSNRVKYDSSVSNFNKASLFNNMDDDCIFRSNSKFMQTQERQQQQNRINFVIKDNQSEDKPSQHIRGGVIKWKMGEFIGTGTFGQVFRAMNMQTGEILAVKKIQLERQCDKDFLQATQEELNLLKTLSHENIVKYLEHEYFESCLYIYLEYMDDNIQNVYKQFGPLEENNIKIYAKQILLGLEYLHSKNVIHRDIKGANILVNNEGIVKLSDFGCAKQMELTLNSITEKEALGNTLKGSVPWMAPEVVKQTKYTNKADIWSYGCTILEMATGQLPWMQHDFQDPIAAIMTIGLGQDIPLIPDNLSPCLTDFLSCCIQRDANKRLSAIELLQHEFISS